MFNASNTTVDYLKSEQLKIVGIITTLVTILSLLGSGSIIVCVIYHRRICVPEIFPIFHLSLADALASLVLLVMSACFLDGRPSYPGTSGPCGYLVSLKMGLFISTFFLTLGYALEAFIRLHRRLQSYLSFDGIRNDGVSNWYMYALYFFSWVIPLSLAIFLMFVTHFLKEVHEEISYKIIPPECSLCFPAFIAHDKFCWNHVENGRRWLQMYKLIFLLPLLLVFILNMFLYCCIARNFHQVCMRRGLLSYHQQEEEASLRKKAIYYQSVFIICWIPTLALQCISFSEKYRMNDYYWLFLIQALLGPLQGFLNCIIYGWKRDGFRRALTESSHLLNTRPGVGMSFTL